MKAGGREVTWLWRREKKIEGELKGDTSLRIMSCSNVTKGSVHMLLKNQSI